MSTGTSALTAEDLKSAAARMAPRLVERQAQAEADRRLSDETVTEMVEAGLVHTQLPPHLGGSGIDMLSEMDVSAALARGCASTGWVRSVLAGATALLAQLPERGVEEVFGGSRRLPVACGVNSLGGQARRVDGGYLVTGSWGFASGCLHADWAVVGVRIDGDDGARSGAACLPMSALTIKDTWFVAGLAATGSNTLVADNVFVPTHLMLPEPPGVTAFLHRSPLVPRFGVVLLGTLVGVAEGLLENAMSNVTKRGVTYFSYARQADSEALLHQFASAAMTIESARLHMEHAVGRLMAEQTTGPMSYLDSTRLQAGAAFAGQLLRTAANSIMSLCGASAFAAHNPTQRAWRDICVGTSHAMLNPTASLSLYGRALAGEPSNSPFWGPDAEFLV